MGSLRSLGPGSSLRRQCAIHTALCTFQYFPLDFIMSASSQSSRVGNPETSSIVFVCRLPGYSLTRTCQPRLIQEFLNLEIFYCNKFFTIFSPLTRMDKFNEERQKLKDAISSLDTILDRNLEGFQFDKAQGDLWLSELDSSMNEMPYHLKCVYKSCKCPISSFLPSNWLRTPFNIC